MTRAIDGTPDKCTRIPWSGVANRRKLGGYANMGGPDIGGNNARLVDLDTRADTRALALVATLPIRTGSEILWDYGGSYQHQPVRPARDPAKKKRGVKRGCAANAAGAQIAWR